MTVLRFLATLSVVALLSWGCSDDVAAPTLCTDDKDCPAGMSCGAAGVCASGKQEENTAARCKDGKDNDGDGYADCKDQDCQLFVFCAKKQDGGPPPKDGPKVGKDTSPPKDGPKPPPKDGPKPPPKDQKVPADLPPKCGNQKVDPGEKCDGTNLAGQTCYGNGYDGGKLTCKKDCTLDTTACYKCGDGKKNGSEQCDGAALGGQTCKGKGFDGGKLACKKDCTLDTAGCYKCGDAKKNGTEQCDGSDLGGKSCKSEGFDGGVLTCTSGCMLNAAQCYKCGDGKINGLEECDGAAVGAASCAKNKFTSGTVGCTLCKLDYGYCRTGGYITVKAGTFMMGAPMSDPCRQSNESYHSVTLTHSFEVLKNECDQWIFYTNLHYKPAEKDKPPRKYQPGHPVANVNWHEAANLCNQASVKTKQSQCYKCTGMQDLISCVVDPKYPGNKIYDCPGFRMPTEAEWEMAARGGTSSPTYMGTIKNCKTKDTVAGKLGWYSWNSNMKSQATGTFTNPYGIADMAGNVWEWTHDTWQTNLPKATNPAFSGGNQISVKGGGYESWAQSLRHAFRGPNTKDTRMPVLGFRCVRTVK